MIPSFDASGNLPPGIHSATWDEVVGRYATNEHRGRLLDGLRQAIESLRAAGCPRVYLDGSFVTDEAMPGDFDACWEMDGVDPGRLDPVLLEFADLRAAQKAKYGGELFPAELAADLAGMPFVEYFQRERVSGKPKGIVAIDLGEWS